MDASKLDFYFSTNSKCFSPAQVLQLRERMANIDDAKFSLIQGTDLKDPTTMMLISVFLGELGVDRFMLGNIGMGILKLCTAGCCGVLWLIDLINSKKMTWEYNYNAVNALLA